MGCQQQQVLSPLNLLSQFFWGVSNDRDAILPQQLYESPL
jgi:hypothetical protein